MQVADLLHLFLHLVIESNHSAIFLLKFKLQISELSSCCLIFLVHLLQLHCHVIGFACLFHLHFINEVLISLLHGFNLLLEVVLCPLKLILPSLLRLHFAIVRNLLSLGLFKLLLQFYIQAVQIKHLGLKSIDFEQQLGLHQVWFCLNFCICKLLNYDLLLILRIGCLLEQLALLNDKLL